MIQYMQNIFFQYNADMNIITGDVNEKTRSYK